MDTIRISRTISIDGGEIVESFMRASGPGGQNVNKVETAVELRFDAAASPGLTDEYRARLRTLAGSRMTSQGLVIVTSQKFRTQERNRADAREKLLALLREAAVVQKPRRPTRPTLASKQRRLQSKARRSDTKRMRTARADD